MADHVLDLRGAVVREIRELRVDCAHELQGMAGPVQEVRIAEGDVLRPGNHQLPYVLEHDVPRHRKEASAVHGRDRTVETPVQTPPARLDVSREPPPAVTSERGIAGEGRK